MPAWVQKENNSKLTLGLWVGLNVVGYSVGERVGYLVGVLVGIWVVGNDYTCFISIIY